MKVNGIKTMWAAGALGGLMLASSSVLACSLELWRASGDATDNVVVGGPGAEAPNVVMPRYSGVCAMQTPANPQQPEYVLNESPGGIPRIRARFYVLTEDSASGTYDIYRGFDDQGGELFTVQLFDLGGASEGVRVLDDSGSPIASCSGGCITVGNWTAIEVDWNSGESNLDLWVNADAASNPNNSTADGNVASGLSVDEIQLGNLSQTSGVLNFDSYESRRTTAIGLMIAGDANGSGILNIADVGAIIAELDGNLQSGQPDCNESGIVNIADVGCVIAAL